MRLTNSARQEAGLFQNIQTVPLCWNGAESLLAVAAGSRGHLTASPAMVTGAVAEMPSTLPPAVRVIGPAGFGHGPATSSMLSAESIRSTGLIAHKWG